MLLASIAISVVIVALLWDLLLPPAREALERHRARRAIVPTGDYDPGRERRAEQRARELLRSCVNEEEWAMYRELGFIRVWGAMAQVPEPAGAPSRSPTRTCCRSWCSHCILHSRARLQSPRCSPSRSI